MDTWLGIDESEEIISNRLYPRDVSSPNRLTAPFPYFGGKSRIAHVVWEELGQPDHYLEPFFGSGAVLLQRPQYDPDRHTETVCDVDGALCNVWRAIQFSPEETAYWAGWPVNHADLMARKKRILERYPDMLAKLVEDDIWHDPKIAGYWIWAASCWIGSGLTCPTAIPHLSHKGMGVHGRTETIYEWFETLSIRLRRVRVVCGDWTRILGGNWQDATWNTVGIFFDPPYAHDVGRDTNLYEHESADVSKAVEEYALKHGHEWRIVLAGYEGEHNALEQHGWRVHHWSTRGGYSTTAGQANENRHRERLWCSPMCQNTRQMSLNFDRGKTDG